MKAIEISSVGGPDVLRQVERPIPNISNSQVLVEVHAAGVNRPDVLQRKGFYKVPKDASDIPGLEISGVIHALGADVKNLAIGDEVVALCHGGGYAQFCAVESSHCLPKPKNLSHIISSCLPETCFTVYYNVVEKGGLKPDMTLLVHGGSSGIGTTAIQIAKSMGVEVIVTAGSDEKCSFCVELGAKYALNYKKESFIEFLLSKYPNGVDMVLDMVGGPYFEPNIKCLREDGAYISIAFILGSKVTLNLADLLAKRITIYGSMLRPQSVQQKAEIAAKVKEHIWPTISSGLLKPHVDRVFKLEEANRAHRLMESSEHKGKICLQVKSD